MLVTPHLASLLDRAVVWESAVGWTPECLDEGPDMLPRYAAAGFSYLSMTMGADWDRPEPTLRHLAQQRRWFEARSHHFRITESVEDIRAAKQDGKLGIGFHLQGASPLEFVAAPKPVSPYGSCAGGTGGMDA